MPIPGARPVQAGGGASADEWAVTMSGMSGGGDTASLDAASLQEGLFSTSMSLRRNTSDHGYGSLGHGHGAWLSSSPHPTHLRQQHRPPPPLFRSPSLHHQVRCARLPACRGQMIAHLCGINP